MKNLFPDSQSNYSSQSVICICINQCVKLCFIAMEFSLPAAVNWKQLLRPPSRRLRWEAALLLLLTKLINILYIYIKTGINVISFGVIHPFNRLQNRVFKTRKWYTTVIKKHEEMSLIIYIIIMSLSRTHTSAKAQQPPCETIKIH